MTPDERRQVLDAWAQALSTPRLANELLMLADNVRRHDPETRTAILREAGRRLTP